MPGQSAMLERSTAGALFPRSPCPRRIDACRRPLRSRRTPARARRHDARGALRARSRPVSSACPSLGTAWLLDLSKERLGPDTLPLLVAHASAAGLPGWIAALFAGEKVNQSERRPALHTALRQTGDSPLVVDGPRHHSRHPRGAIENADARRRRSAAACASAPTGRPIRAVVNLGIGGSDLGAFLVCSALARPPRARGSTGPQTQGVDVSFVANVDPEHLTRALAPLEPATTLFVITSKSFATPGDARECRERQGVAAWPRLGKGVNVDSHFMATTANVPAARAFGVASADILPLWDWVSGRLLPVVARRAADRAQDRLGALREAPGRRGERRRAFPRDARSNATCRCSSGSSGGGTPRI